LHFAIQRLHWSPSDIKKWFEAENEVKAFYFASAELRVKTEAEEREKIRSS
jgi:hypothetical protein